MPVWVKSWVTLSCSLFIIIIIIIIIKKHALKIEKIPLCSRILANLMVEVEAI